MRVIDPRPSALRKWRAAVPVGGATGLGRRAMLPLLVVAVVAAGCTSRWTECSLSRVASLLRSGYVSAAQVKQKTGHWPATASEIPSLRGYFAGDDILKIGDLYFRVVYTPSESRILYSWHPLITLHRVDAQGHPLVAWEEVYAVNKSGKVAIGQGWSADWLPAAIIVGAPALLVTLIVAYLLKGGRIALRRE